MRINNPLPVALAIALVGILLLSGCASRPDPAWTPAPAPARLVELIGERLELSQKVAWYKYREGLPIVDRKRESESFRNISARARAMGLSSWESRRFLRAQMAASRMIQRDLIAGWKTGSPLPAVPPPDLARELRPRLEAINNELVAQLAAAGASARGRNLHARAELYLRALDIPDPVAQKALRPLR